MANTALLSGGKDSVFAAYVAEMQGIPIDEVLTLRPSDPESLMFHTPNLSLVALQAEAWGKRYREVPVGGTGEAAERMALTEALRGSSGWVVAGAIASSYQWSRLHAVTTELGRPVFTPLWGKEAGVVVRAEIDAGLDIRLVHLAAEPLTPELLGRRLDLAMLDALEERSRRGPRLHVAGEGGEFETLVVDAPFFDRRVELAETEVRGSATVHSLVVRSARLVAKDSPRGKRSYEERLSQPP